MLGQERGAKPCEERAQCTKQIKSSRKPCPEAKRRYRRCMHRRSIRVLTPKPKVHAPQNDLSQWVLGIPLCHSSEVDDRSLGGFVPPEVRKDQLSQIVNFLPKKYLPKLFFELQNIWVRASPSVSLHGLARRCWED